MTTWLIVVIGAVLGLGARRVEPRPRDPSPPALVVLSPLSIAAFAGVEARHIRAIRKVFLSDAAVEPALGAAVAYRWLASRESDAVTTIPPSI